MTIGKRLGRRKRNLGGGKFLRRRGFFYPWTPFFYLWAPLKRYVGTNIAGDEVFPLTPKWVCGALFGRDQEVISGDVRYRPILLKHLIRHEFEDRVELTLGGTTRQSSPT